SAICSMLYWDGSYEIALRLIQSHPDVNLEEVTLQNILEWTVALPDFADDPALVNDEILTAIYSDWLEEITTL
ncbi:MAG: Fe-S cluster assembly protein IscX, partial [Chloroflexota bacterium]